MYDYSENLETQKLFILNYQKEDDKIIIHFADGKEKVIPNTKVNEEKLLKKMEGQLKNIDKLRNNIQIKIIDNKAVNILFGSLTLAFLYLFTQNNYNLVWGSISLLNTFVIILESCHIKNLKKKREELDKFKYFKENEEILNTNVKMKENVLQNTSKKAKFLITTDMINNNNEEKVFNINSIDKLSLEDLKMIRDNIALEKEFDFEYPNNLEEKGAYTKKR